DVEEDVEDRVEELREMQLARDERRHAVERAEPRLRRAGAARLARRLGGADRLEDRVGRVEERAARDDLRGREVLRGERRHLERLLLARRLLAEDERRVADRDPVAVRELRALRDLAVDEEVLPRLEVDDLEAVARGAKLRLPRHGA